MECFHTRDSHRFANGVRVGKMKTGRESPVFSESFYGAGVRSVRPGW